MPIPLKKAKHTDSDPSFHSVLSLLKDPKRDNQSSEVRKVVKMLVGKNSQLTSSADRIKPWSVRDDSEWIDPNDSNHSNFKSTQNQFYQEHMKSEKPKKAGQVTV